MSDRVEKILRPFEENKAYMEDRITSGIEANRKGLAQLVFVDKDGKPVQNVHVEVRQKTHDFRFGANCFMIDELETDDKMRNIKSVLKSCLIWLRFRFTGAIWNRSKESHGFQRTARRFIAVRHRIFAWNFVRKTELSPSCIA